MFNFLKRKKAECIVINDSSNYCYVDGVPHEVRAWHMYDFDRDFFWNRHRREFSLGVGCNKSGYSFGRPRICVSTERRAGQLFDFIDKLFYTALDLSHDKSVRGGFKHLFICVKSPVAAQYVNELLDSKDDPACSKFLGWYQKHRKKVHVIPYSVCVACEDTHRVGTSWNNW